MKSLKDDKPVLINGMNSRIFYRKSKSNKKDKVNIFDITDKFENKNMTYKQYLERVKIYQELEYKMKDELNYTIKKI